MSPRKKKIFTIAAIAGGVALAAILFLLSPFFHLRHVQFVGNYRLGNDELVQRLNLGTNTHLILFNENAARRRVMENMYVRDVQFERVLDERKLYVIITERHLTAYVEHIPGSFLFLDDQGRVLEIRPATTEQLPVLVGLQFTRFQVGEILEVPDVAAFSTIVLYAQLLRAHGLIDQVSHINVRDTSNIRIVIDNIEFNVGGASQADEKVRTIVAILEDFPHRGLVPGSVDMRIIGRQFVLEILQ